MTTSKMRHKLIKEAKAMLNLREQIDKLYNNETIIRFSLKDQASKLLLKFIEHWQNDPNKYLSLAEVKRNFRTITTEDARIVIQELEQMRLIVNKIRLAQFVYKFNDDPSKWTESPEVDLEAIVKFKDLAKTKLQRKLERARKVLKKHGTTESVERIEEALEDISNLSALERHERALCGGKEKQCRICLAEEGLGF